MKQEFFEKIEIIRMQNITEIINIIEKSWGSEFYWLPFRFMYREICERKDDRNCQ